MNDATRPAAADAAAAPLDLLLAGADTAMLGRVTRDALALFSRPSRSAR